MFVEFLSHVVSLDLVWVMQFILGNLHWLFAFFAISLIFFNGKKIKRRFIILVLVPWIWFDLTHAMGLVFLTGIFLVMYYVGEIALMKFAEDSPQLENKLVWVEEGWFLSVLIAANFIL